MPITEQSGCRLEGDAPGAIPMQRTDDVEYLLHVPVELDDQITK